MKKNWRFLISIILLLLIFKLLLLINLKEPILDEKLYLAAAKAYLKGAIDPNFQHPPLGKELLALGLSLFGENTLGLRVIPMFFGLLTIIFTYLISSQLFKDHKAGLISTSILATETFFFIYSSLAYLEIILVSFSLITVFFLIKFLQEDSPLSFFFYTIFLSAAVSVKLTGLFLIPPSLLLIYLIKKEKFIHLLAKTALIGLILLIFYLFSYASLINSRGIGKFLERQKNMIQFQMSQTFKKHQLTNKIDFLEFHPIGWFLGISTIFNIQDGQIKSISYYPLDLGNNYASLIIFVINPFVLWPGLLSLFVAIKNFQRSNPAKILTIITISLVIPYFLSGRIVYPYYILSALPFFSILITYAIYPIWRKHNQRWKVAWFLGCCLLFFLLMSPLLTGIKTPSWYYSWIFQP